MHLHFSKTSSFKGHVQQHSVAAMMDLQKLWWCCSSQIFRRSSLWL